MANNLNEMYKQIISSFTNNLVELLGCSCNFNNVSSTSTVNGDARVHRVNVTGNSPKSVARNEDRKTIVSAIHAAASKYLSDIISVRYGDSISDASTIYSLWITERIKDGSKSPQDSMTRYPDTTPGGIIVQNPEKEVANQITPKQFAAKWDTDSGNYRYEYMATPIPFCGQYPLNTDPKTLQEVLAAGKTNTPVSYVSLQKVAARNDAAPGMPSSKENWRYDKRNSNVNPRMPPLGVVEKINTPAHIRIYDSANSYDRIDCFLLRQYSSRADERMQVFQAINGDVSMYFFGERPRIYSFSGIMYDTYNQQWANKLMRDYDSKLRGTKSIENRTEVCIVYEDKFLQGFVLNLTISKNAELPSGVQFTLDYILTKSSFISLDGTTLLPSNEYAKKEKAPASPEESQIKAVGDATNGNATILVDKVADLFDGTGGGGIKEFSTSLASFNIT